jgi:hypothetical protein
LTHTTHDVRRRQSFDQAVVKESSEEFSVAIVRAFDLGRHNTLYLTISKDARKSLNLQKGTKFLLKIDGAGRLVYEPIRERSH